MTANTPSDDREPDESTDDGPHTRDDGDEGGSTGDGPVTDVEELTDEDREELIEELERRRSLRGSAAVAVAAIGIAFSAFQMWIAARGFQFAVSLPVVGEVSLGSLQLLQVNALHVSFGLVLAFLLFPPSTGDGFLSARLGRIVPKLRSQFGTTSPITRAAERVRGVVRWAVADPDRQRITPVDYVLIMLALLAAVYMITDFDEIRRMRALGLDAGRPLQEVFPFLDLPVRAIAALGIPLDEVSYAFLLGAIGVLLVLEATRRALGVYLMLVVAAFVVYAKYGWLISPDTPLIGVLSIFELRWAAIVQNLWYNVENGVFGVPVTVSVRFIYIFILFGAFLEMSGAGKWFIDLAYAATGKRKGGPAKASIVASGFMGTISGSSIANTVTTGAFTIPLMKRSGYRPEFAGAVEASASSGGQILPPVMGAAAFLIVEYTLTPFADVIMAAALPAIVFFFGVWVMVHLEASRENIGGIGDVDVVAFGPHMKRGWFYLLPLGLLLFYLIVERLSVARSAWFTIVAILALIALVAAYNERTRVPLLGTIAVLSAAEFIAYLTAGVGALSAVAGDRQPGLEPTAAAFAAGGDLGWLVLAVSMAVLLARPSLRAPLLDYDPQVAAAAERTAAVLDRPQLARMGAFRFGTYVLRSMEDGARTATAVVIAVAAAGIIPGVISVSGLGPNLTALIRDVAGGSIILLLIITAIASIILGMGMPTTVTYIILVATLGPAIATPEFGIPLLAAHLFILYFGVIADITPPVAVAAYAASGIAKSDQFRTGVEAFSLSLNKVIVPFAFVLSPGILLLRGTGTGEEVRVIGFSDVAELGFFVPEVVVPVVGMFVGVVALGPTVIGYLYTDVGRVARAAFALAALLLMAPGILSNPLLYPFVGADVVALDFALRGAGAALFTGLVLLNRRRADGEVSPAPATDTA